MLFGTVCFYQWSWKLNFKCSLMALAMWDILEAPIFVTWLIIENWRSNCSLKLGKDNERATSSLRYISEAIKKFWKIRLVCVFTLYRNRRIKEKGSRDLLISQITNRVNNISNHTRRKYNLHCLCNILVVKIPKIKVRNPSPFRKTCLVTALTKQSHVLFEIAFYVFFFFSFNHICNLLFRIPARRNHSK